MAHVLVPAIPSSWAPSCASTSCRRCCSPCGLEREPRGLFGWLEKRMPSGIGLFCQRSILIACVTALIASNHRGADLREDFLAYDYGTNVLAAVPPDSVLITNGDVTDFSLDYLQYVEGARPDVRVIHQGRLCYSWYVQQIRQRYPDIDIPGDHLDGVTLSLQKIIEANRGKFPLYFCGFLEEGFLTSYREVPLGFITQVVPREDPIDFDAIQRRSEELFQQWKLRGIHRDYPAESLEWAVQNSYADACLRMGLLSAGAARYPQAGTWFLRSVWLSPSVFSLRTKPWVC